MRDVCERENNDNVVLSLNIPNQEKIDKISTIHYRTYI